MKNQIQTNILKDVRKQLKSTSAIVAMIFIGITAVSCEDAKKDIVVDTTSSEVNDVEIAGNNSDMSSTIQNPVDDEVLADYMKLKEALVATNQEKAAKAAKQLEATMKSLNLENYTSEQKSKLQDMLNSASQHASEIANAQMESQREHFELLSEDVTQMVEIAGAETKLYQQFCPMYGKDGGAWLSLEENIRNPYFGDKMMKCGEVKKEFN